MDEVVLSALRHVHGLTQSMEKANSTISPLKVGRAKPHPSLMDGAHDAPWMIWLIGSSVEQMRSLEYERWSVDAGPGPHLLLHLNRASVEDLPQDGRVKHLCIDDVARFLGHTVMQGWAPTESAGDPVLIEREHDAEGVLISRQETYAIRPRINAREWAEEREISTTLRPVLRRCRALIVAGQLIGPENEEEGFEQILLDPGIHAPLEEIETAHLMEWTPSLDEVEAGSQRDDERLREELIEVLSIRRVMPATSGEESARILRWWRPDVKAIQIDDAWALLPAWEVNVPGMQRSILCGWSGVVLAIN